MTQEEKAKAYDEALEHFKAFKEKYYTKDTNLGDVIFDKTGEMQKDFESIFPQLRESEDEKSYKRIEQLIRLNTSGAEKTHLLAYIEKKKEITMPNSTELIEMWHKAKATLKEKDFRGDEWRLAQNAFMDGFTRGTCVKFEKQKEQKPNQSEEEREYVKTLKGLVSDFIRDSGGAISDVTYYQRICDWLDERHIEQKPLEKQDYSRLNDLERAIHRGFLVAGVENIPVTIIKETAKECLAQINPIVAVDAEQLLKILPQKPAWSEDDKQWLSEVYFAIDHSMYSEDERQAMKKYIDSLRSQSKPTEWSEEDNEMRLEAIRVLVSGCERYRKESGCLPGWHKVINWLKSLRPQPKQEWSEEDADMLNCCISSIEEAKENRYAYKETDGDTSYDHEIEWLKSLRPYKK